MARPLTPPTADAIRRLALIVGAEHALVDPATQAPYLHEWRERYVGRTPLVLRPGSTEEVAQILRLASEQRIGVVPQSGNTGLVGGQIPFEEPRDVVLSLARLKRIRAVDPAGSFLVAEAGVTLAEVQAAAERAGRLFPLSMASEGSACIGGNLATNAGGVGVLAYGSARRLALGLEVVLADGRVWDGLRTLAKDNTGYDLRDLFIGSEGTLGIITAAALKLFPRPAEQATAFAGLDDLESVLALFRLAEDSAGDDLTAFEFLPRRGMEFLARHLPGARAPLAEDYNWLVLAEISGRRADGMAAARLEAVLAEAAERGIVRDAAIASSLAQAAEFWRLREAMSEMQKPEGGSIKHDVSVPIGLIPQFITRADALVARICPGARPVPFGHFGDGNVHYNVSQPVGMEKARFLALWEEMQAAVHGLVTELGGSISAEHGIGRMKRDELVRFKSPVELDLMRRVKAALDPDGILNPGKVV
ncbi:MAG: FAD-binding oxidoreductase [Pseudomonadota bacterium]